MIYLLSFLCMITNRKVTWLIENKTLSKEELDKIVGGIQNFCDYNPPTVCLVCGKPLTKHPVIGDLNEFPLFVCSSNVYNENHWVVWKKKN